MLDEKCIVCLCGVFVGEGCFENCSLNPSYFVALITIELSYYDGTQKEKGLWRMACVTDRWDYLARDKTSKELIRVRRVIRDENDVGIENEPLWMIECDSDSILSYHSIVGRWDELWVVCCSSE